MQQKKLVWGASQTRWKKTAAKTNLSLHRNINSCDFFFGQNISCEEGQHLGAHVKLRLFVFNFGTSGADLSKIKSSNVGQKG